MTIMACGIAAAFADDNVRAAQTRLRQDGFYFGDPSGVYDKDTAAAVTRYQIRSGLAITGKLDLETSKALRLPAAKSPLPAPKIGEDVWRYLRKTDQDYISRIIAEEGASKRHPNAAAAPSAAPSAPSRMGVQAARRPIASQPTPATQPGTALSPSSASQERLRDYVGAFVLAGLDPKIGSELEFFAVQVDYFGEKVNREKIRRDLVRYDQRWPERRFWLTGELQVTHESDGRLRITFPLRYELRSPSAHAAGKVLKTLLLEPSGDDLRIVAVNEHKAR